MVKDIEYQLSKYVNIIFIKLDYTLYKFELRTKLNSRKLTRVYIYFYK